MPQSLSEFAMLGIFKLLFILAINITQVLISQSSRNVSSQKERKILVGFNSTQPVMPREIHIGM